MKKQSVGWWGRKAREGSDDLQSKGSAGLFPSPLTPPQFQRFPSISAPAGESSAPARLVDKRWAQLALGTTAAREGTKSTKPICQPLQAPRHPASRERELQANYKPCIFILRDAEREEEEEEEADGGGKAFRIQTRTLKQIARLEATGKTPRYRSPAMGGLSTAEGRTGSA